MTSAIHALTVDCHDPERVGRFWAAALDFVDDPDNPNSSGDPEWVITSRDGAQVLLFIPVPEPKSVKNRLHLDLQPSDTTRDAEVERLGALGATVVADHRRPDGTGWVTMADPEGNEFDVERSAAERAAQSNE